MWWNLTSPRNLWLRKIRAPKRHPYYIGRLSKSYDPRFPVGMYKWSPHHFGNFSRPSLPVPQIKQRKGGGCGSGFPICIGVGLWGKVGEVIVRRWRNSWPLGLLKNIWWNINGEIHIFEVCCDMPLRCLVLYSDPRARSASEMFGVLECSRNWDNCVVGIHPLRLLYVFFVFSKTQNLALLWFYKSQNRILKAGCMKWNSPSDIPLIDHAVSSVLHADIQSLLEWNLLRFYWVWTESSSLVFWGLWINLAEGTW